MRLASSTSSSALSSGDLADLLEVGADRVGRGGELGVLAGLPQRLGLLLVPDEVARLLRGAPSARAGGAPGGAVRCRCPRPPRRPRRRPPPRRRPRASTSVGDVDEASSRSALESALELGVLEVALLRAPSSSAPCRGRPARRCRPSSRGRAPSWRAGRASAPPWRRPSPPRPPANGGGVRGCRRGRRTSAAGCGVCGCH